MGFSLGGLITGGAIGFLTGGPAGAVVGGLAGGLAGGEADKANKRNRQLEAELRRITSPEELLRITQLLTPELREQFAASLTPSLQSSIAGTLEARGLTGTGLGEVLRALSRIAPEIAAVTAAGDRASDVVGRQVSARTGAPFTTPRTSALDEFGKTIDLLGKLGETGSISDLLKRNNNQSSSNLLPNQFAEGGTISI